MGAVFHMHFSYYQPAFAIADKSLEKKEVAPAAQVAFQRNELVRREVSRLRFMFRYWDFHACLPR